MKIITRKEAIEKGLKRFFTGKPCYRGHVSERLVSNRTCLQCHAEDMFIRQVGNREHARELDAKSRQNRPWNSLRHLKENHSEEAWKQKLKYMQAKNQERRDYSIGSLSSDIVDTLIIKQSGKCNGCLNSLKEFHIDHMLPLVRGGTNTDDNVQLLCPTCNLSKGSKTMNEWKGS